MKKFLTMAFVVMMLVTMAGCSSAKDLAQSLAAGDTVLETGKQWGDSPLEKEWELDNGNGTILEYYAENQAEEGALIVSLSCDGEELAAETILPGESTLLTQELTEETKTYLCKAVAEEEGGAVNVSYKILQKSSESEN